MFLAWLGGNFVVTTVIGETSVPFLTSQPRLLHARPQFRLVHGFADGVTVGVRTGSIEAERALAAQIQ